GGQLLGLAEIVLEGLGQRAGAAQRDQALVALGLARVQARVLDGDRQQRVVAQLRGRARGVGAFLEAGNAADGAGRGALGEQRAQGAVGAQLDRQPPVHLHVSGEKGRRRDRLAQQGGG